MAACDEAAAEEKMICRESSQNVESDSAGTPVSVITHTFKKNKAKNKPQKLLWPAQFLVVEII